MENKKLVILCAPMSAVGHMNAFLGFACALRKRGHEVVFAVDVSWKGKLIADGYKEELYNESPPEENVGSTDPAEHWSMFMKLLIENADLGRVESFEFMLETFKSRLNKDYYEFINSQLDPIVEKVKPDVIITEVLDPSLLKGDIPYVLFTSPNPLALSDPDELAPPFCSGLSVNDKHEWKEFRLATKQSFDQCMNELQEYMKSKGISIPKHAFIPESKWLNLYLYPEELDYTDIRPLGANYFRIDAMIRDDNYEFSIPKKLENLPGKLIYLSMGSMGSVDVGLMRRLTGLLAKSKNKFIVSKGIYHDQYDLPSNMWGDKFLPQINILKNVDLFITHGGNNSVTEALYFGKPLIVLPLFADQFDNGIRVQDKGLGYTFNPNQVTEEEINNSIEILLNDEQLKIRLKKISERIKKSNTVSEAVNRIENIINNNI